MISAVSPYRPIATAGYAAVAQSNVPFTHLPVTKDPRFGGFFDFRYTVGGVIAVMLIVYRVYEHDRHIPPKANPNGLTMREEIAERDAEYRKKYEAAHPESMKPYVPKAPKNAAPPPPSPKGISVGAFSEQDISTACNTFNIPSKHGDYVRELAKKIQTLVNTQQQDTSADYKTTIFKVNNRTTQFRQSQFTQILSAAMYTLAPYMVIDGKQYGSKYFIRDKNSLNQVFTVTAEGFQSNQFGVTIFWPDGNSDTTVKKSTKSGVKGNSRNKPSQTPPRKVTPRKAKPAAPLPSGEKRWRAI